MRASLAALLLILPLASGCLDSLFGADATPASLLRIVQVNLDPESMEELEGADDPDDVFAAVTTTTFVYTHEGAASDPDDITVRFTGTSGRPVEKELSDYTTLSTVSEGDRVTITGAIAYSQISIKGGGVEAERGGIDFDWLRLGDYPVPLAIEDGASASWDADLAVAYALAFDHFRSETRSSDSYSECDWDRETSTCNERLVEQESYDLVQVDDALLEAMYDLDGSIRVSGEDDGRDFIVDLDFDGEGAVSAAAEALVRYISNYTYDGELESDAWEGPAGFDAELSADGDTLARFIFEDDDLLRTGSAASYQTGGHFEAWGDGYTREDPFTWFDDEEWPADDVAYEEMAVQGEPEEPDEDGMALLEDLWGMDLAPGDRFEFLLEVDEDGVEFQLSLTVSVEAEEEITVEAGTFPALRIESSIEFDFQAEDMSPQHLEFDGMTHWVHATTYLPLLITAAVEDQIPEEDIQAILDELETLLASEDGSFELPSVVGLTTSFEGNLELADLDGTVRMPGLLSGLGIWAPYAMASAGFYMFALGGLGYGLGDLGYDDEYDYEYEEEPLYTEAQFPGATMEDAPAPLTSDYGDLVFRLISVYGDMVWIHDYTWEIDGQPAQVVDCDDGYPVYSWEVGEAICLAEMGWQAAAGPLTVKVTSWDDEVVLEQTRAAS